MKEPPETADERAATDAADCDRWVDIGEGGGPAARAGALLRQALRPEPLEASRLAAVRARLRRDVRRPQRHWAMRLAVALALVLTGSALTAGAQLYFHLLGPARPAAPEPRTFPPPAAPRARAGARAPRTALAEDAELPAPVGEPFPPLPPPAPAAVTPPPAPDAVTPPPAPLPPVAAVEAAAPTHARQPPPAAPASPAQFGTPEAASPVRVAPAAVTPPPALPVESASALARESALLAEALRKLRQDGDARGALATLDDHDAVFAGGALAPEATLARIEALLRLRRDGEALVLLDRTAPSPIGRGRDLLVARAELRAAGGRCAAATADFDLLLTGDRAFDPAAERALRGRASCRAAAGDAPGARSDLQDYLARYPNGRFTREVRAALGQ